MDMCWSISRAWEGEISLFPSESNNKISARSRVMPVQEETRPREVPGTHPPWIQEGFSSMLDEAQGARLG